MAENWEKVAYEDDVVTKALMTAAGDIFYASGASTPTILAKGSDGDILTLASGVPAWDTPSIKSVVDVYPSETLSNLTDQATIKVMFDSETLDTLGEFDNRRVNGAADATEANKLHDADGGFEAGDVGAGIYNTTDDTWAEVTGFVDSGELDLSADIMADGESYILYRSWFTAASNKYLAVTAQVHFSGNVATKEYYITIYRDGGALKAIKTISANTTWSFSRTVSCCIYCTTGQTLEVYVYTKTGGNTVDLYGSTAYTFFSIHEIPMIP